MCQGKYPEITEPCRGGQGIINGRPLHQGERHPRCERLIIGCKVGVGESRFKTPGACCGGFPRPWETTAEGSLGKKQFRQARDHGIPANKGKPMGNGLERLDGVRGAHPEGFHRGASSLAEKEKDGSWFRKNRTSGAHADRKGGSEKLGSAK